MKKILEDFLSLSSLERKGIIVVLLLITVVFIVNYYIKSHESCSREASFDKYEQELAVFKNSLFTADSLENNKRQTGGEVFIEQTEMFDFDPNTVSASELRKLGLNDRLIRTILNYRRAGGRFFRKEDMLKIYGMNTAIYNELQPWINFSVSDKYKDTLKIPKDLPEIITEINSADTALLKKLPGIGTVLSNRIVKYRSLLGGFHSCSQLTEVYGIQQEVFQFIEPLIKADTSAIRKININLADEYELSSHPYLDRYTAEGIIAYRNYAGNIENVSELLTNNIIPSEVYNKVKYYLSD